MIVASGRSALTFSAPTSASSAWTTIRSALPFALAPTVNCHNITPSCSIVRTGCDLGVNSSCLRRVHRGGGPGSLHCRLSFLRKYPLVVGTDCHALFHSLVALA